MPSSTCDPREIEQRLLELAHTTDAKITVPTLAYYAGCSLAEASHVLDDLAVHERLTMEVDDDGTIRYELPGRQKLDWKPAGRTALVPLEPSPPVLAGRTASPLLAAILTLCVPGAGHLYSGRVLASIVWFLTVTAGYALVLPGLVLHLCSIASAANTARRLNAGSHPFRLSASSAS